MIGYGAVARVGLTARVRLRVLEGSMTPGQGHAAGRT